MVSRILHIVVIPATGQRYAATGTVSVSNKRKRISTASKCDADLLISNLINREAVSSDLKYVMHSLPLVNTNPSV